MQVWSYGIYATTGNFAVNHWGKGVVALVRTGMLRPPPVPTFELLSHESTWFVPGTISPE
jgi:hypothetical protein